MISYHCYEPGDTDTSRKVTILAVISEHHHNMNHHHPLPSHPPSSPLSTLTFTAGTFPDIEINLNHSAIKENRQN